MGGFKAVKTPCEAGEHHFEARYEDVFSPYSPCQRRYLGDICIKCGLFLPRQDTAPPQGES